MARQIPVLKQWSHLPVILDPSQSTGYTRYVTPIARAGVAAGADGDGLRSGNDSDFSWRALNFQRQSWYRFRRERWNWSGRGWLHDFAGGRRDRFADFDLPGPQNHR